MPHGRVELGDELLDLGAQLLLGGEVAPAKKFSHQNGQQISIWLSHDARLGVAECGLAENIRSDDWLQELLLVQLISLVPGIAVLLKPPWCPRRKAACGKTARAV
jgi:hypothetical protein